jgi:hypothetical protein
MKTQKSSQVCGLTPQKPAGACASKTSQHLQKKNARSQAVYQHLQYLDANTLLKNNCADASSRRYASDKKRYMLCWIPKPGLLEPIRRATTSSREP